uniref:Kinetochore protein SPC25 n=1 Tax=Theileria annulata TaxID=5874 RepID=A0A3B0N8F2_THEAN
MALTHHGVLDTIKEKLDKLSKLDHDFLDPDQNSSLLSTFNDIFNLTSEFIKNTSKEDLLISEFVNYRNDVFNQYNDKLQNSIQLTNELEKQKEFEEQANKNAKESLKSKQLNFSDGEFRILMSRQEIMDKLNEWKHICDLEQIEIKKLKCQIDILEDKISTNKFNSNQISYYNKLYYELLTSALKISILNVDEKSNVNLAILSESKKENEQTWHRFSSSKDCDVATCDFLWNLIEKSLCNNGVRSSFKDPNTPKLNSIHLVSRNYN